MRPRPPPPVPAGAAAGHILWPGPAVRRWPHQWQRQPQPLASPPAPAAPVAAAAVAPHAIAWVMGAAPCCRHRNNNQRSPVMPLRHHMMAPASRESLMPLSVPPLHLMPSHRACHRASQWLQVVRPPAAPHHPPPRQHSLAALPLQVGRRLHVEAAAVGAVHDSGAGRQRHSRTALLQVAVAAAVAAAVVAAPSPPRQVGPACSGRGPCKPALVPLALAAAAPAAGSRHVGCGRLAVYQHR